MEVGAERERRLEAARSLVDRLRWSYDEEHAVQVRQVELVVELVGAYATLTGEGPSLPGQERLVSSGSEGTPLVTEHLATELAPRLQMPVALAGSLICRSVDLVFRHPSLWRAVREGRVRVWQAHQLTDATRQAGLGRDAAGWVDAQIAASLGRLPWGRVKRKVAGLVVRADIALAARRAEQARQARFVRVRQQGDGTAFITARTDAAVGMRLCHTLGQLAGQLALGGDTDPLEVRRATALGVLAQPAQAVALLDGPDPHDSDQPWAGGRRRRVRRRRAELVIHLAPGSPVGRCEEVGPVLAHQVKEWLGHDRVVVRPVVDLSDEPAVDTYEVPDRIARIVRGRHAFDVFPWSTIPSSSCDLDHTIAYDHTPEALPGQTRPANLGPLSRRAHNAKTHAGWQLEQPAPGVYHWTSPLGHRYRVDPAGSHEITGDCQGPDLGSSPPTSREPTPRRLELTWPQPGHRINIRLRR